MWRESDVRERERVVSGAKERGVSGAREGGLGVSAARVREGCEWVKREREV